VLTEMLGGEVEPCMDRNTSWTRSGVSREGRWNHVFTEMLGGEVEPCMDRNTSWTRSGVSREGRWNHVFTEILAVSARTKSHQCRGTSPPGNVSKKRPSTEVKET